MVNNDVRLFVECFVCLDLYLDAISNVATVYPNRSRADGYHHLIDFDLSELRRLAVHERRVPFTNTQVYPSRFPSSSSVSFPLATLNETIELLLGLRASTGRSLQLLIEIKTPEFYTKIDRPISPILLRTLRAYNLTEPTDPVVIQTFHIEELFHIRRNLSSRLRLVALLSWNYMNESSSDYDFYRNEEGLTLLSSVVQAIAPNMELLVDGSLGEVSNLTALAHKHQLAVYPWTFRKDTYPGKFEQLIDFFHRTVGVDGFITSQPDIVIDMLEGGVSSATFTSLRLSHLIFLLLLLSMQ